MTIAGAPVPFRLLQSVQYGKVPGGADGEGRLYLDLLLPETAPEPARPAVVYFHGGGWAKGSRSDGLYPWLCPVLAAHGFVSVSVGYRLTPQAPFPAQIHDAKAAIRFLRARSADFGIDPDRIGAWGDSSGGHLAALLGTTAHVRALDGGCGWPDRSASVQAVITRCAPTDFGTFRVADEDWRAGVHRSLFGGPITEHEELAHLASPIAHVQPDPPPFLIVHGTEDETVPYSQATTLARALEAQGGDVALRTVVGGHHNLLPDLDAPWRNEPWTALGTEACEFFVRHLGRPARDVG